MAMLFDVSTDNIGLHIANILAEGELDNSTTEKSSVVQTEGKRRVKRNVNVYKEGELDKKATCAESAHMGSLGVQCYTTKLYNLDMIISVGYRVRSKNCFFNQLEQN